jgi:hypothetical protein
MPEGATCCHRSLLGVTQSRLDFKASAQWCARASLCSSDRCWILDLTLEIGPVSEVISVRGELPQLQASNAEISDIINESEMRQVPLNGRNFLALAQLSDAVVIPPSGTRGEALQQAGPLPNVGGQLRGPRSRRREDVECRRHSSAGAAVGSVQRAQQGEFRHPEPHLRDG